MKGIWQLHYFVALMLMVGFVSNSQAATGYAGGMVWQVGDIIACIGGGTCNAIRVSGNTVTLLDQFSDTVLGDGRGVWMNNTLHAVAVDNGGGNQSKVVVYTIASVNPFSGLTVSHTPVSTFTANGPAASGNNAQAVLVSSIGHIFVGNAGAGGTPGVSIVELNPDGSLAGTVGNGGSMFNNPLPVSCADIAGQRLSMDLSKDGLTMYLTTSNATYQTGATNGGHIQKVTLSSGACTPFASFGLGVALNGIQDIPPSALAAVVSNCNGTLPCPPTRETILVVAEGFFDSDGDPGPGEPNTIPDSGDDVNICTNSIGPSLVSCALLLDTGGPGLIASPWVAGNPYLSTGTKVLDANLHVQQVMTAGTSGSYPSTPFHPAWSITGGTTVDNRVTWQDEGHCGGDGEPICPGATWTMNNPYTLGQQITDPASHIQQVTVAGTSGPADQSFSPAQPVGGWNDLNGNTFDGLTWTDLGTSVVAKYIIASGLTTLQSLSLDPLVTNCTVNNCSSSIPVPTVSNFWAGDSANPNVYKANFANGSVSGPFNINGNMSSVCPSPTCTSATAVQGFRIYGAEGSYQADLTKLFTGSLAPSGSGATVTVSYPPAVGPFTSNDTNTWTLTQYQSANSTPITLYASLISQASAAPAGNNSGATDPNWVRANNTIAASPVPCFASTTDPTKCIIWKADVQIPSGGAYLSETMFAPNVDDGTDLFVDLHYDITVARVEDPIPGGSTKGSVHSLHEVPAQFTNSGPNPSGCTFSSPVEGACYKTNRGTLNFTFQCSGLSQQQFANLQFSPGPPYLGLGQTFPPNPPNPKPAPKYVVLNGTNGKGPYRYSTSPSPNYTFQWALNAAATSRPPQIDLNSTDHLTGCTFDPTGTVQPFCVHFTTDPNCK